ncbi:MAG TPA: enoyl-CoA hydratase-related protein [Caulobacteraceae bacterium]|nr:enoyl-CoA hydratase-related protein [Caulobacteraceae bacterium]
MTEHLLRRVEDGVMTLTFNRPDKKNAITDEMYDALAESLGSAARDDAVRAILFLSTGDSFTAGNDLASFARQSEAPRRRTDAPSNVERFIRAIANAGKPVVAGVRGRAVGIGLTMLLHCDLVFVAEDAELSAPFVTLALVPEAASSLLLVARLGHARAFSIFAGGRVVGGRDVADWGLASQAVPADEVDNAARAAAKRLARQPGEALAITKRLMRDSGAITARIDEELGHFADRLTSPEAQEAFRAFAERRTPDFLRVESESWWERSG